MEMVLDVYKQPYDPLYPVVCMDESLNQSSLLLKQEHQYRQLLDIWPDMIMNTAGKVPVIFSWPMSRWSENGWFE
jgi:hypothetical protein